jgi:hypothetical protein
MMSSCNIEITIRKSGLSKPVLSCHDVRSAKLTDIKFEL